MNPQEEINLLEFSLVTGGKGLERELISHKLNETTATLLKMIIAAGLYPQYSVVDPTNNFRTGHDQFAHTLLKPFVVLHPNSSLGQMPESLRIDTDSEGASSSHQFVFYGLLLETTKPFLCNSVRIPTPYLFIFARNIVLTSSSIICCDGFIEFCFIHRTDCHKVLEEAYEIRNLFLESLQSKMKSNDYTNFRPLETRIIQFARFSAPFSIRRMAHLPKNLKYGIFDANGNSYFSSSMFSEFVAEKLEKIEGDEPNEPNNVKIGRELDEKKLDAKLQQGRKYFCSECDKILWFQNNVEIIKHKKLIMINHDITKALLSILCFAPIHAFDYSVLYHQQIKNN